MQDDLFSDVKPHDAGGRRQIKLEPGVHGDAEFCGPNDCFRPLLRRWVGSEEFPDRYVNFIGMNASTASASFNDPTIGREWSFTRRFGYAAMIKTNIADYRATHPSDFIKKKIDPATSDGNLEIVLRTARAAGLVIVGHGDLNKVLEPIGQRVIGELRAAGIKMMHFGLTASGNPRHTLYILATKDLEEWI